MHRQPRRPALAFARSQRLIQLGDVVEQVVGLKSLLVLCQCGGDRIDDILLGQGLSRKSVAPAFIALMQMLTSAKPVMKMMGICWLAFSCCWKNRPLSPRRRTSSSRQLGPRLLRRLECRCTSKLRTVNPTERRRFFNDERVASSSSMM
jgi:hypothetical protein